MSFLFIILNWLLRTSFSFTVILTVLLSRSIGYFNSNIVLFPDPVKISVLDSVSVLIRLLTLVLSNFIEVDIVLVRLSPKTDIAVAVMPSELGGSVITIVGGNV